MKYLLVLLLFVGCSGFRVAPGVYTDEPEFERLTNEYLYFKDYFLNNSEVDYPIVIEFVKLEAPKVGSCVLAEDRSYTVRYVRFDIDFWDKISKSRRFNLFLHEMGHCDLNLGHQDDSLGIMNTYETLYKNDDKYIENLFLRGL